MTVAPGIAAPEGSATCPRNAPLSFCARDWGTAPAIRNSMSANGRYFSSFMIKFPIPTTSKIEANE